MLWMSLRSLYLYRIIKERFKYLPVCLHTLTCPHMNIKRAACCNLSSFPWWLWSDYAVKDVGTKSTVLLTKIHSKFSKTHKSSAVWVWQTEWVYCCCFDSVIKIICFIYIAPFKIKSLNDAQGKRNSNTSTLRWIKMKARRMELNKIHQNK